MQVLVTQVCRPRDGVKTFMPGNLYDLSEPLGQRIIDGECGEELTKQALESKSADEVKALAPVLGITIDPGTSKKQAISTILGEAPEPEDASTVPRGSQPDARSQSARTGQAGTTGAV